MASIGWPAPLPFTPGYDFSGVIESISNDVSNFKVGDEVYGCHWGPVSHTDEFDCTAGTFAEYLVVPVRSLLKKPSGMSHTQAAAIACVGMTSTGPLDKTEIGPGSKILILGGSTSVGMLAIQNAKLKGAWVATTASSRAMDFVSQFGADQVINYNETKW
jgi:NADPH:quinone reductase-like Zn-dependent oxidoreductase